MRRRSPSRGDGDARHRFNRALLLTPVAGLLLLAGPLEAQQRIAGPVHGGSVVLARATPAAEPTAHSLAAAIRRASTTRLVIGGVLGAAVGILACNLISEAIEEVEESSHCTTKGNLLFGIGGAVVGVAVASLTD